MYTFVGILYWKLKNYNIFDDYKSLLIKDDIIYIVWQTDLDSPNKVINFLKDYYFDLLIQYDITTNIRKKLYINYKYLDMVKNKNSLYYSQIRYIGKTFEEVLKQFQRKDFVSIREAENVMGYQTVKIDIIKN